MKTRLLSALFLLVSFSTCSKETVTLSTGERYEDISISDIKNLQGTMSDAEINSTHGDDNQIPENAILVFRTGEGNFGKMQILNNTVAEDILAFKYELYNSSDELLITSDYSTTRRTYTFNFETDEEGVNGRDFWWEWNGANNGGMDGNDVFLVPFGGCVFNVYR